MYIPSQIRAELLSELTRLATEIALLDSRVPSLAALDRKAELERRLTLLQDVECAELANAHAA